MFKAFVDRVIKSYKSTLIGLGIGVACVAIDMFVAEAEVSEVTWIKALGSVAVLVGASLRSKALPPAP